MTSVDYIVVGAGLTGATIARRLADAGREVLVLERRPMVGGNVRDAIHRQSGLRYHVYGPHYFRTNDQRIWDYVHRFTDFSDWRAEVLTDLVGDGQLKRWPLRNPEADKALAIDAYNLKMWGTKDPPIEVKRRVEIDRLDDNPALCLHAYQGIPKGGYSGMIAEMLKDIPVKHENWLDVRNDYTVKRCLIYTGPIDEYYGFELGRLAYRGQKRSLIYMPNVQKPVLPCIQVNRPHASVPHLREIEWNHLPSYWIKSDKRIAKWLTGSLITTETPFMPSNPDEYEYPYRDDQNRAILRAYQWRADSTPNLIFAGRLGEYRYLDMDQAIARALMTSARLIEDS